MARDRDRINFRHLSGRRGDQTITRTRPFYRLIPFLQLRPHCLRRGAQYTFRWQLGEVIWQRERNL